MEKPKQLNFNTLVSSIVLAAVGWVGVNITDLSKKQHEMSEDIAVIKASNPWKQEQLNRIEGEQGRVRAQLNAIQMEQQRLKNGLR